MVYYSNITNLQSYVRFVAKEHCDKKGIFWRLYSVEKCFNNGIASRDIVDIVMACDTYEELAIWCDLQNIKIHHKEINSLDHIHDDVSIVEEGKDYFMIEDKNDKIAIGILLLAGVLTLGGFVCSLAMFIKHM